MQTTGTADELRTGGTVLPITRWGTPVMHTRTRPVVEFDDELHELVADMFATMYAAEGVGLAATQVGVDLAVFVFDCPDDDHVRHVGVICNPEVTLPEGKDRHLDDRRRGLPVAARRLRGAGPARTTRSAPARTTTAGRSRCTAPDCSPAACSTRPTTSTAPSSATGSPAAPARSCTASTRSGPTTTPPTGR